MKNENYEEEERDTYNANSYQPMQLTHQSKKPFNNNFNAAAFFQPIPSQLFYPHQSHLTNGIYYYSSHSPEQSKPLVFVCIHGAGHSGMVFGHMAKMLLTSATLISYDLMCHGNSNLQGKEEEMTIENLKNEAIHFWKQIRKIYEKGQRWVLIGHSLGGSIAIHLAEVVAKQIEGLVIIDAIEGAAKKGKSEMIKFLKQRPQSFESLQSAIKWNYKAGCVRRIESARFSIPSQVKMHKKISLEKAQDEPSQRFYWKVDLLKTVNFWDGWFDGVSAKFNELKVGKKIFLGTTKFRLDEELLEGLEAEKFQIKYFDHSGHSIHQDEYEKVSRILESQFI